MFITLDQRKQYRKAIASLGELSHSLDNAVMRGVALDPRDASFIKTLTETSVLEEQYNAIASLLDETTKQYEEKLLEAAPHRLSHFVEFMTIDEPPAAHHEWMCERIEAVYDRRIMRLGISMPPGHAKTKFASRYGPAWYIGRRPQHKFIQGGHSQDFVENQLGAYVRDILKEERYRRVFPGIRVNPLSTAKGAWSIVGRNNTYTAKGVGQKIAGYRGNIACIDDPYGTQEDAESPTIREKTYNWFTWDLMTRLLPGSPVFVVATRWHSDDILGRLEQATKAGELGGVPWEFINLPALAEDDDPLGREPGEPLWPDYYDEAHLLNLKAMLPPKAWNSLYMGRPSDAEGGVVNQSWFQYYDEIPKDERSPEGNLIKKNVKRITVSVDCASKDNERANYTVATVWIQGTDGLHYLVDVKRERVEFDGLIKLIEDTARNWNAHLILVEDKGAGTQYIQQRQAKAPAPVLAVSPGRNSKEFRFDGVSPFFETGRVRLPTRASWLADYEREILSFPNGKYDDQVDSTSQYLDHQRQNSAIGTKKMKGLGFSGASRPHQGHKT